MGKTYNSHSISRTLSLTACRMRTPRISLWALQSSSHTWNKNVSNNFSQYFDRKTDVVYRISSLIIMASWLFGSAPATTWHINDWAHFRGSFCSICSQSMGKWITLNETKTKTKWEYDVKQENVSRFCVVVVVSSDAFPCIPLRSDTSNIWEPLVQWTFTLAVGSLVASISIFPWASNAVMLFACNTLPNVLSDNSAVGKMLLHFFGHHDHMHRKTCFHRDVIRNWRLNSNTHHWLNTKSPIVFAYDAMLEWA